MAQKKSVKTPLTQATFRTVTRGPESHFDFPCVSFIQAKERIVLFVAKAKLIWELVQINKREEDKDEGYQRALSPARAEAIARFIDKGNILPTSVLISLDHAELLSHNRTLRIENRMDAGWVIDGQHRLGGAHKASTDLEIPVVGIMGLDIDKQINCFVTINREQKGVPSSLYYELLKHLPGSRSETDLAKERAADMAGELKTDESSPFYAHIVTTVSPKRGELSLTNWVRKIAPLIKLGSGRLSIYSPDTRKGVLNNYYRAIQTVFPREFNKSDTVFFKTLGFGAMMNVLPVFLDICMQLHNGFRLQDAVDVFKKVDHIDFSGWHQRGSGNAAENQAAADLITELQNAIADTKQAQLRVE